MASEIKANGGIQHLSLWNRLTKRHLSEKNNVLGNINAYEPSLPYKNSHRHLDPNVFGLDSSVWSKSSDKTTATPTNASTEPHKICPSIKNNVPSVDIKCQSTDVKKNT